MYNASNHICTIIGKAYLIKGLALYLSLSRNLSMFHLWICCVDKEVYDILSGLELLNVTLYRLEDIEDDELRIAKENRSFREYCWTLKAPLILYIFLNNSHVDDLLYLDADTFIFADIKEIYEEWGTGSILLCKQRDAKNDDIYGIYQAGVLGFKKDEYGLKCLKWWRSKCIDWCYDRYDDPVRWGDQKYMNNWTELFDGVVVVKSLGIDTAAWYLKYHSLRSKDSKVYIDEDRLVLYHFTSFFIINESEFTLWKWKNLNINNRLKLKVYFPYIKTIKLAISMIKPFISNISAYYSTNLKSSIVANYIKC